MPAPDVNITSLFDIVVKADTATGGLLIPGALLGLNFALVARYSNRKHGLMYVGAITAFLTGSMAMLLNMPALLPLFILGFFETIIGAFLNVKENMFDM